MEAAKGMAEVVLDFLPDENSKVRAAESIQPSPSEIKVELSSGT